MYNFAINTKDGLSAVQERDTRLALTIACRIDYTHFFAFFGGRGLPSNRSLSYSADGALPPPYSSSSSSHLPHSLDGGSQSRNGAHHQDMCVVSPKGQPP